MFIVQKTQISPSSHAHNNTVYFIIVMLQKHTWQKNLAAVILAKFIKFSVLCCMTYGACLLYLKTKSFAIYYKKYKILHLKPMYAKSKVHFAKLRAVINKN